MKSLADFLDHLPVKSFEILRTAARHQSVIDDDLPIDPIRTRIFEVNFKRRIRSHRASSNNPRIDQRPRSVANRCDRFSYFEKMMNEFEHLFIGSQCIRIFDATWK